MLISNTYTFGSAADLSREIAVVWIHKSETHKQVKNHQKFKKKLLFSLKNASKWSENWGFFFGERIREILVEEGINQVTPYFTKIHFFHQKSQSFYRKKVKNNVLLRSTKTVCFSRKIDIKSKISKQNQKVHFCLIFMIYIKLSKSLCFLKNLTNFSKQK